MNVEGRNRFLKEFCYPYNLKNLIKVPTCFKNLDFSASIYVMLTTKYKSFHNSCATENRFLDFDKMIVTIMKLHFQKKGPQNNSIYAL